MRTFKKRWGEITVKKQGGKGKNDFEKTRSLSIYPGSHAYSVESYAEIIALALGLTEEYSPAALKHILYGLGSRSTNKRLF